jgi:cytochrome c biogenesis protein ResB
LLNSLRGAWWLFANVRSAIALLAVLSLVSLLGLLLPQVPSSIRGDAVMEADWRARQGDRFGALADPMDALGLFDVFHARWFAVLLTVTTVSTGVYVLSRAPGVWRSVTRPRTRAPDRYFEVAATRLYVAAPLDAGRLEAVLRRGRYRVVRTEERGATHLFADRFQWAQFGTLLTHAAVIVFILSAVVSRVDAYSAPLALGEGDSGWVESGGGMLVELIDASATFEPDGRAVDFRSRIAVYQGGELVKECESTVNSPCAHNGVRFYQSGYFPFGAAVEVRDGATGDAAYAETVALMDSWPSPRVVVRDGDGQVLFDQSLVLTDNLELEDVAYSGTLVGLPGGRVLAIGIRTSGGEDKLAVYDLSAEPGATRLLLAEGETGEAVGISVTYAGVGSVPAALVPDFPLPASAGEGDTGEAFLQMSGASYGGMPADAPRLTIIGLGPQAVTLGAGESVTMEGRKYTFLGQREVSGITAKRDRSDVLVWAGAAVIVLGLMITFWVPRRRLWAKITTAGTWMAGQATSHANYSREIRRMAREAGAEIPGSMDDDD